MSLAQPGSVRYVTGDATRPHGEGPRLILHVCNDLGRWGKGFVLAISRRWTTPRQQFLAWHAGTLTDLPPFGLGKVQFVEVEPQLWVANLVGQHGLRRRGNVPPVRYDAIRSGLEAVTQFARDHSATVHMPRIGCGLAGGTWERIEPILRDTLLDGGVDVVVYDLPESR